MSLIFEIYAVQDYVQKCESIVISYFMQNLFIFRNIFPMERIIALMNSK